MKRAVVDARGWRRLYSGIYVMQRKRKEKGSRAADTQARQAGQAGQLGSGHADRRGALWPFFQAKGKGRKGGGFIRCRQYVKCDGLGEQAAVSWHGQMILTVRAMMRRRTHKQERSLQRVKAPSTSGPAHTTIHQHTLLRHYSDTTRRKTFLGLPGTLSWAKHGRPIFQALLTLEPSA